MKKNFKSLIYNEYWCKCLDVINGDTCKVSYEISPGKYKIFNVFLSDMSCDDINSENKENKRYANLCKNRLLQLITFNFDIKINKNYSKKFIKELLNTKVYMILIKIEKFDKYGRILAKIYTSWSLFKSLQNYLISENFAILDIIGDLKIMPNIINEEDLVKNIFE